MKLRKIDMQNKKIIQYLFIASIVCFFGMIYIFNYLTPYLSDDYIYATTVREAKSIWSLFSQEYDQYMNHGGRSVVHLIDRFFLFMGTKSVFNLANSVIFMVLIILVCHNVTAYQDHKLWILFAAFTYVWLKGVSFSQTVLWQTGACNYLWGSVIIIGFITCYRHFLKEEEQGNEPSKCKQWLLAIGFLFFGVLAGWCNENTSVGGILIVLMFLLYSLCVSKIKIKIWMVLGLVGQMTGMLFMVSAPGNKARAEFSDEQHVGIVRYIARLQKITLNIKEEFILLICVWILLFVLAMVQKKTLQELHTSIIYFVAFLATSYALIGAPPPQYRAYWGASLFLLISVLELVHVISLQEDVLKALYVSVVIIGIVLQLISFVDDGTNLWRIKRDILERENYILTQKDMGISDIVVSKMRPDFENYYTDAFVSDLDEDPGYWMNYAYEMYYEVESISAIPREEWDAMLGQ